MATETTPEKPPIDVDDLAREKVQEVEDILDGDQVKLDSINNCFSILKQIITAADLHRTNNEGSDKKLNTNSDTSGHGGVQQHDKTENSESIYADYADDHEQFNAVDLTEQFATNSVKWTIRVRAFKSVHRILNLLLISNSNNKLLALNKSTVLKILPDLVRLSFVAATSPYDDLKIQGFQMFRELISRFASVEEREFPGHSILEQYKTQVLSALKPAFNLDAPPYITAIASQVCCLWICRGLEKDSPGLKRAYQLMKPSIEKLESQSINPNSLLYQEIELEQERLDILGSWAQLYTTSLGQSSSPLEGDTSSSSGQLLSDLIADQIECLVSKWWEALKDYALLIMLSPKTTTATHDNEHVYTREVALMLFSPVWPKLALAVTSWLCTSKESQARPDPQDSPKPSEASQKYFHFICGLLMNEFCRCPHLEPSVDSLPESTLIALKSLCMLMSSNSMNKNFINDLAVAREFYTILGGTLMHLTKLKGPQKAMLRGALSQIFKLVHTRFTNNDKIVQYTMSQLIAFVRAGLLPSGITRDERVSQLISFTNLIVVARSRPDLLVQDPELLDAFLDIFSTLLSQESNPNLTIQIMDGVRNLQKNLPNTSVAPITKRVFEAKQSKLLQLLVHRAAPDDKNSLVAQKPEWKILVEIIIKSMKLDMELLEGNKRQELLVSLVRTLIGDEFKVKNDDLVNQIIHITRDLEKCFAEEFARMKETADLKSMIETVLKPLSKDDVKDLKATTKKPTSSVLKKPSSKIVLKSDFSNFYSKK